MIKRATHITEKLVTQLDAPRSIEMLLKQCNLIGIPVKHVLYMDVKEQICNLRTMLANNDPCMDGEYSDVVEWMEDHFINGQIILNDRGDIIEKHSKGTSDYWKYEYSKEHGKLIEKTNTDGTYLKYQYDSQARMICSWHPARHGEIYTRNYVHWFDSNNFRMITDYVETYGRKNIRRYDNNDNLLTDKYDGGRGYEYVYDENNNLVKSIKVVRVKYDPSTNKDIQTIGEVIKFKYNDRNLLIKKKSNKGWCHIFKYHDNGRLALIKRKDSKETLLSIPKF